ncbi:hypothetical protein B0J13DRAFT_614253 [Dactylonectria estremocensis]|uniref:2EXR domain-containing protein n=1 Tax=Dactylonectria estremocensis TaxID=1079267 RepID=A0A9P9D1J7_9HYPO|nr:hypothetical protein B0J13DRAFT_614253 [Dactylonectria estremocensis]
MASNPEMPPGALAFAFQDSTSNFQLHKWTPTNGRLPRSLQALKQQLPLLNGCASPGYLVGSISSWAEGSLVNEENYEAFMADLYRLLRLRRRFNTIPERYWLFQFVVQRRKLSLDSESWPISPQALPTELPQESQCQPSQPKGAFTCFNRLPTELKVAIWLFSLPTRQITHIKHMKEPGLYIQPPPLPTTLLACRQSYDAALRYYKPLPSTDMEGESGRVLCNIETGILLLDQLEYRTDMGDDYKPGSGWCSCRGFHSHLNEQSHPWDSFRLVANFPSYTGGELTTGPDMRLDVRVQPKN